MQSVAEFVEEFLNADNSERIPADMLIGQIAVSALAAYMEDVIKRPQVLADKALSNEIGQKYVDKVKELLSHLDIRPSLEKYPAL